MELDSYRGIQDERVLVMHNGQSKQRQGYIKTGL